MKKNKITRISDFEETCMWMSYRYAIGRQSIASVMHANDIAKNLFYRIPNDRKQFTAYDIAREIDNILRWKFNLYIDFPNVNRNFHPIDILMRFIKENNITNLDDLSKYESIRYSYETDKFTTFVNPNKSDKYNSYITDIGDLMHWQKLSECFDVRNLKVVKTNYNGKEEEFICFKSYWVNYGMKTEHGLNGKDYMTNDLENVWWTEHWVNINDYISGHENMYIADEYVVSVRDIEESELKQFEGYEK